jgi:hypothetical protein
MSVISKEVQGIQGVQGVQGVQEVQGVTGVNQLAVEPWSLFRTLITDY